ncbi:hypothetical protein NHQ30_008443 [Ciborinia camelliae]|nr:hypothetical protein NHQ30_008443 [Ciborinia camelliae]
MRMRYHGFTDYLWIDSLCINQDNDGEKNFQVAIMGSIYESALWVASCLGTGETIGVIQPVMISDGREAKLARMKLRERFDQLPYFDRVWIKQEIILARDVTLFYGLEKISWEKFDLLINMVEGQLDQELDSDESMNFDIAELSSNFYTSSQEMDISLQETEINSTTVQLCNHRSKSKSGSFVELVLRYRTAKATNSRDKIYALLSLLPKEDLVRQNLVIDYGQPTFYLFHAIVRLVYFTYEDLEAGQKHQVLDLIREWVDINENNPELDDYLKSIPSSPSDWLPSSTSDLANPWIKGFDPHIMLDIMELCQVRREDELEFNLSLQAQEYTPLTFLEHINTWRRDDKKWTKADINQLLPINLKSAKVTYIWPNIHSDISPGMKEFLVNADVRAGDFIAKILWGGPEHLSYATDHWTAAHAVFRAVDINGKDEESDRGDHSAMHTSDNTFKNSSTHPSAQEDGKQVSLALHSWAIPVARDLTLLTKSPSSDFNSAYRTSSLGELKLHHRDALIPLILNHRPLHALMYPAPEGSAFSIIRSSAVESGNRDARIRRPEMRKADYDYLRDVLG